MRDRMHYYHTLMLAYANAEDGTELFEHYDAQARQLRLDMAKVREPWIPELKLPSQAEVIQKLENRYYEEFGDPESDEWQNEFARLMEHWQSEDDEEEDSKDQIGLELSEAELLKMGLVR